MFVFPETSLCWSRSDFQEQMDPVDLGLSWLLDSRERSERRHLQLGQLNSCKAWRATCSSQVRLNVIDNQMFLWIWSDEINAKIVFGKEKRSMFFFVFVLLFLVICQKHFGSAT